MKRVIIAVLFFTLLTGCKNADSIEPGIALREQLLQANECRFTVVITADYTEYTYTFTLDCISDKNGNITFCVIEPESIRHVTGRIDSEGGRIVFDDQILAFPLIADDQLTPVSVPWLLMRTLRGGYISAGGKDGDNFKLQMDDSFEEDPLTLDIWLDDKYQPIHCDFLWRNRRILTAEIKNFSIL